MADVEDGGLVRSASSAMLAKAQLALLPTEETCSFDLEQKKSPSHSGSAKWFDFLLKAHLEDATDSGDDASTGTCGCNTPRTMAQTVQRIQQNQINETHRQNDPQKSFPQPRLNSKSIAATTEKFHRRDFSEYPLSIRVANQCFFSIISASVLLCFHRCRPS